MKLIERSQAAQLVAELKAQHRKIVFTNGCFDILHAGHVRYLNAARQLGDCLILGLNSDSSVRSLKGSQRPINVEQDRAEVVAGLAAVDYVIIFAELTAEQLISEIQPDIYAKGGDYSPDNLPEAAIVREHGGQIVFIPLVAGKSSSNIIAKINQDK